MRHDYSLFFALWLWRFHRAKVQELLAAKPSIAELSGQSQALLLRELHTLLETEFIDHKDSSAEWLEFDLVCDLLEWDSAYGAGESLLVLFRTPLEQCDWRKVAELLAAYASRITANNTTGE